MVTKTKAELEAEIRELKREIEQQKKQEQIREAAITAKNIYEALLEQGFAPDDAMALMIACIKN